MKSKKNIVFLGMMGSGKTSLGSLISKKLNLIFFDIDRHIEKELNMKITEIFKTKGEKIFRELEEKITLKILKKSNIIISLGGGAFLNRKIRKEVLINHLSFWLKWDHELLLKRIKNNPKRPVAFKLSNNELINMMKERSKFYSKALYKINCNNCTKIEIANKVLNIYENNKINN
jgi:shikimate kinase